ncbi:MAG: sugar ABC transporter ATP-binding protein [Pseudomonadota bacterium]
MTKLLVQDVSRRYGAVQALDRVSLTIEAGRVHALMGENGAGKSTLIRLLAGLEAPDKGFLSIDGARLHDTNAQMMRQAGLRFIHQELHAVQGLSVAENMHLDHPYPTRLGLVHWGKLNQNAAQALGRLGLSHLDPRAPMSALGLGDQMLVRIAATLIRSDGAAPWLYVMDEPTAALTVQETDRLFAVIDGLVAQGAGILYVSHRMPEVMQLADQVSVLRDGRHVSTRALADTDERTIIEEMTGRPVSDLFPTKQAIDPQAPHVLTVDGLKAGPVKEARFSLRAGEVLGVAGLAGSGRGGLLRALIGDTPVEAGSARLHNKELGTSAADGWANGVAYVPRERRAQGLMLRRSITENITLPHLSALSRAGAFLDRGRHRRLVDRLNKHVGIKATSMHQSCHELSGGNQQKVLFARALAGDVQLLLLDEPTRGVDVGAKADLYGLIQQMSDTGLAVIIASSDLPELLGLAHRIAIMRDSTLAEIVDADGLTEADLLARFYHVDDGKAAA